MRRLLSVLFLPICLQAAWVEVKSGPFVVLSDAGEGNARAALNHLEQFRHALGAAVGRDEMRSFWPMVVVVSKNASPQPFALARDGYLATWPAGAAPPPIWFRQCALLLMEASFPGRLPQTLEVALADLYSTLDVKGTRLTLGAPPEPAARTRDWARLHLLATRPETSGRIRVLLSNLSQGGEEDAAYRNAFEKPAVEIDKLVDPYLAAGRFGTVNVSGKPIDPERQFHVWPASPAQVKLLPADQLLARDAPAAQIRTAYQAAATPCAQEGLGLLEAAAGNTAEAKTLLAAPTTGEGCGARGYVALAGLETGAAKAAPLLEAAAKKNPSWSLPHVRLAALEANAGKKAWYLKKAAALEPRSSAIWRSLAETLEASGQLPESVKAWRSAERAAATQAERDELRNLQLAADQKRIDVEAAARAAKAKEERDEIERIRQDSLERIRQAEAKANAGAPQPKAGAKVEKWWDGPPTTAFEGTLERVDCLGRSARLALKDAAGKPFHLLIPDPKQIVIMGGGDRTLGCGPQRPPRRVKIDYVPKPNARLGTAGDAAMVEFP